MAPVFLEKPENKIFIEGTTDFIEAVVDGNPFPTVSWFKVNRECMDGPKYINEVDQGTGVAGLQVKKIKSDDEAKYTIKIQNSLGEESATCMVFVKCINIHRISSIKQKKQLRLIIKKKSIQRRRQRFPISPQA